MDAILWWALGVTAFLNLLGAAWAIRREWRAAKAMAVATCPQCGEAFGPGAYSIWRVHTRRAWRCAWSSGPYMQCGHCGARFRYTWSGALHPQQFETHAAEHGLARDHRP